MAFNWSILPPIAFSTFLLAMIVICYFNGIIGSHYHFFIPLISDLGNFIPEAPLFSSSITGCAVLWMITVTIRFLQLRGIIWDPRFMFLNAESHRRLIRDKRTRNRPTSGPYNLLSDGSSSSDDDINCGLVDPATGQRHPPLHPFPPLPPVRGNMHIDREDNLDDILHYYKPLKEQKWFLNWNLFTYLLAIAAGLATCGVASFRIHESFFYHYLAGLGVVILPPAYIIFQTYFSYRFYPQVNSKKMFIFRMHTAIMTLISFGVLLFTSACLIFCPSYAKYRNPVKRLYWSTSDNGYWLHVLNSISEWCYIGSLAPFIYTFTHDFGRLGFDAMKLEFPFGNLMMHSDMRVLFKWHPKMGMQLFHDGDHVEARADAAHPDNRGHEAEHPEPMRHPHHAEEENVLYQR